MYKDIFESIRNEAKKRNLRERTIQLYCSDVSYFLRWITFSETDVICHILLVHLEGYCFPSHFPGCNTNHGSDSRRNSCAGCCCSRSSCSFCNNFRSFLRNRFRRFLCNLLSAWYESPSACHPLF